MKNALRGREPLGYLVSRVRDDGERRSNHWQCSNTRGPRSDASFLWPVLLHQDTRQPRARSRTERMTICRGLERQVARDYLVSIHWLVYPQASCIATMATEYAACQSLPIPSRRSSIMDLFFFSFFSLRFSPSLLSCSIPLRLPASASDRFLSSRSHKI